MAASGKGKKTIGWILVVVGGLLLLGGINHAMTNSNLSNSHDVSKLAGSLGVPVLILVGGLAMVFRK